MRKFLLAATAISMLLAFTPSQAASKTIYKKNITFRASTPCLSVCPHNIRPLTDDASVIAGIGDPAEGTLDTCATPFPPGSWADFVVTAPPLSNTLVFKIYPTVDWDSFICSKPARGRSRQLGEGASGVDMTVCQVGCAEEIAIRVRPGTKYILRAYNWSDANSLPANYRFVRIS